MKVTKQQMILAGVLVLGGVALACDRFVFAKSGEADAASPAAEYAVATPAKAIASDKAQAAAGAVTLPAAGTISIAQRLRDAGSVNSTLELQDAFALGNAWEVAVEAPKIAVQAPAATAVSTDKFRAEHRLTGVLTSGGRAVAMIDAKIVAIGQNVDGFKLVSIAHRTATFECQGTRVVLSMSEREANASATN